MKQKDYIFHEPDHHRLHHFVYCPSYLLRTNNTRGINLFLAELFKLNSTSLIHALSQVDYFLSGRIGWLYNILLNSSS